MKNILLVYPDYPIPHKSIHHKNALPIGLLKLSSYYKNEKKASVQLVHGNKLPYESKEIDIIEVTSLFTYWSQYVWDTVAFYREAFPDYKKTKIRIGGIYASLHHDKKEYIALCRKYHVSRFKGVNKHAEKYFPDYKLLIEKGVKLDFQIVHTSRGCHRRCTFCGTWIIEPEFECKNSILKLIEPGFELGLRNLVFYDNNLLKNPNINAILGELIELKRNKKIGWCESQSGFDGRLLLKEPELASLLRQAGFRFPRIAWDWGYDQWPQIKKQIKILIDSGFSKKNMSVFMIYGWDIDFKEMEKKRIKCWEWGLQITDCRFRPLDCLQDKYNPLIDQSDGSDYYIHPNWTDAEIKQFRKNIRRQNICIRMRLPYHSKLLERKVYTNQQYSFINTLSTSQIKNYLPDLWYPDNITHPLNNKWKASKNILSSEKLKELDELMFSKGEIFRGKVEIVNEIPGKTLISSYIQDDNL